MRLVIQRVLRASCTIDSAVHSEIGQGFLVLVGVRPGDTPKDAEALASKCAGLRVFEDAQGKMNLSLGDISGEVLAVSNFTLYADCSHGRRPSFTGAAVPAEAEPLYDAFCRLLAAQVPVKTGVFGADMKLELINDGPITLVLDAENGRVL